MEQSLWSASCIGGTQPKYLYFEDHVLVRLWMKFFEPCKIGHGTRRHQTQHIGLHTEDDVEDLGLQIVLHLQAGPGQCHEPWRNNSPCCASAWLDSGVRPLTPGSMLRWLS